MFTRFTESTCVPSLRPVEAECFPKSSVTECNAQLQSSRFYFIVGTQKKTKRVKVKDYTKNT